MDLNYSAEELAFRDETRSWLEKNLPADLREKVASYEHLSRDDRLRLVEAIWGVVYSDGSLAEVEGHLARRIAELLGFQHPEVQAAKERVATRS